MRSLLPRSIVVVSLAVVGCGLGLLTSMRDTTVPAADSNYDALGAEATKLGWRFQRGGNNGVGDWPLEVFPAEGERIIFAKNNNTDQIAFTCDGGTLDDDDACDAAAGKLLIPAFGNGQ